MQCGSQFAPKRKTAKYCSDKCKKKASRDNSPSTTTTTTTTTTPTPSATLMTASAPTINKVKDTVIDNILKDMGLSPLPTEEERKVRWIPSGIPELDDLIRTSNTSGWDGGGFPTKRITEMYGRKGIGKTTIMSKALPKLAGRVLYIDAENALFGEGSVPNNVTVIPEPTLEIVEGIVSRALDSDAYDVIVIDSVASLVCQTEVDGDSGQAHIGLKARLMHQWMRRITPHLKDSDTAVVFINQERISIGMFATKYTPGGTGLDFASSLRIELTSNSKDKIVKGGVQTGHWVNVKLEKNRFGPLYTSTKFKAIYDTPIMISDVPSDEKVDVAQYTQEELDEKEIETRVATGASPDF